MAYNKITSHFSSSETFNEDRYFVWDKDTDSAKFVEFVDIADGSNVFITGSENVLHITGAIDTKNNISGSKILSKTNDKGIFLQNSDSASSYVFKKRNNNLSINAKSITSITGTVSTTRLFSKVGLTGSLIYVNDSDVPLLQGSNSISTSIVDSNNGMKKWLISQNSQSDVFVGRTYILLGTTNTPQGAFVADDTLIATGSTTITHYNDSGNSPLINISSAGGTFGHAKVTIDFSKFTTEHKNYISSGKHHLFYIDFRSMTPTAVKQHYYLTFKLNFDSSFSSSQLGAKYLFILGESNRFSINGRSTLILPAVSSGAAFVGDVLDGDGVLGRNFMPGSSFLFKCIGTNKWAISDDN